MLLVHAIIHVAHIHRSVFSIRMLFSFTLNHLKDMEFLDVLTEGLERVLLVRGGGREVVTIYS